ncbi:hypothetical protein FRC03_010462 [Tulasnella sp. 419]|nr:hypothetical protein FRC02_009752 [Tulasnella sp. 418]KAG8967218.1 hypothetical protein FRC03_010462 [Tulasnella sp. 419]
MIKSALLLSSTVALSAIIGSNAATIAPRDATCPCGYQDSNGAIWREGFNADFTQDYTAALSNFYAITSDPVTKATGYKLKYDSTNVYPYNYGMAIRTQAYSGGPGGIIHSGEIESARQDIRYGTFRMRAVVPTVPGVCFGFFTYRNNVQESDIEFLSSDPDYYQRIHYTNQPSLLNGNVDLDAVKEVVVNADLTAFHEHRFDWTPTASKFYLDGSLTTTITKNIPNVDSLLIANVWSDGEPLWSQGPPTADALATIYYIKAYFNSSSLNAATFDSQCAAAGHPAPCQV